MKYSTRQSIVASERDALEVIRELGLTNAEEVGKELGFSAEYTAILIRSLHKQGYVRGTSLTGYEVTEKGKAFVAQLAKERGA
ncbi:hypothetical protein MYX78_01800 [Acidobacteria bacterium AH-259-G07]|nr:hypothetical protein [Acidobacteria bacterium AH-259-G07]